MKIGILAIIIAVLSLIITLGRWLWEHRVNKKDRRQKFFQQLINGFYTHNWKFIEHWNNKGIRPQINTTVDVTSFEDFGRRVVLLDHINILWQVFLHREILNSPEDIESFKSWADSWFENSKDQLKIIFEDGDMLPLDYIIWLRDTIFKGELECLMGDCLKKRIQQYEIRQRKYSRLLKIR